MADLNAIVDQLSTLTVMEAAELAKLLEDKWGVSAAAPVAVAAVPGAGGGEAAAAEEKVEFDVILVSSGDKKIQVIKEVRAITWRALRRPSRKRSPRTRRRRSRRRSRQRAARWTSSRRRVPMVAFRQGGPHSPTRSVHQCPKVPKRSKELGGQ
jgi:ribosomal protein L7/L12